MSNRSDNGYKRLSEPRPSVDALLDYMRENQIPLTLDEYTARMGVPFEELDAESLSLIPWEVMTPEERVKYLGWESQ